MKFCDPSSSVELLIVIISTRHSLLARNHKCHRTRAALGKGNFFFLLGVWLYYAVNYNSLAFLIFVIGQTLVKYSFQTLSQLENIKRTINGFGFYERHSRCCIIGLEAEWPKIIIGFIASSRKKSFAIRELSLLCVRL